MTATADALSLARSRFANAMLAYDAARDAAVDACAMRTIAYQDMVAAGEELSRLSRLALDEGILGEVR